MLRLPRVYCPISLKWDLDIGKILFTLSFVKHEQSDFSLILVNGKSIGRKYFLKYYDNHFRQFCFQSEPEVKGIFQFTIYNFFSYVHGDGQVLHRLTVKTLSILQCFWQERLPFYIDVASSLKPLSQIYCGPTRFHLLEKVWKHSIHSFIVWNPVRILLDVFVVHCSFITLILGDIYFFYLLLTRKLRDISLFLQHNSILNLVFTPVGTE